MQKSTTPFFVEFFRDSKVAAIIPSTRFVVHRVLSRIDFSEIGSVIEFGAGEGVMTRATLERLRTDGRLTAFEPNASLRERLVIETKDSRLSLVADVAENMERYLEGNTYDLVLASNPFSKMNNRQDFFRNVSKIMNPEALFIIFNQHIPVGLKRDLKKVFNEVVMVWEPRNLPPWSFIFFCSKPRHD